MGRVGCADHRTRFAAIRGIERTLESRLRRPGTDLVPLATMLPRFAPELQQRARFLFPEAPLDLAELGMPDGRAWWHLDIFQLQEAVATGRYRDMPNASPEGLPAAPTH